MQISNVLIIVDHLGVGGAQEHVFNLCRNLQVDDIHITVCALHTGGKYKDKLESVGIPVVILSPRRHLLFFPVIIWRLFKFTINSEFNIIHTFLPISFAIGTPISRLQSIPTVHTILTARLAYPTWYTILLRLYYPIINLILIPMFRPIPKDHPALLRKKIKVASVAIDLDAEFALDSNNQHAELPDDISTGDPMVISIGRLHPDKGHEFAIQAWAQVIREMPAAKLSIVGKGKDELRLKKLTQSLDLTDQVVFISYLESLAPLFQHADIYLAPSINEGTNLTSMQAMAAGLAVIGFNNEVDYEIIRHGQNGILVAQKNVQELAQAIIKLSKDKILRSKLEHNARQTINQIYHLQDVISYHQQIYTAAAKAEPLESILDMR